MAFFYATLTNPYSASMCQTHVIHVVISCIRVVQYRGVFPHKTIRFNTFRDIVPGEQACQENIVYLGVVWDDFCSSKRYTSMNRDENTCKWRFHGVILKWVPPLYQRYTTVEIPLAFRRRGGRGISRIAPLSFSWFARNTFNTSCSVPGRHSFCHCTGADCEFVG